MSTHSCLRDSVFFYIDPPPTEIYTLSLHDALPIYRVTLRAAQLARGPRPDVQLLPGDHDAQEQLRFRDHQPGRGRVHRSEEHTSELQSRQYLVCRLLLEKKNRTAPDRTTPRTLWHT